MEILLPRVIVCRKSGLDRQPPFGIVLALQFGSAVSVMPECALEEK